MAGKFIRTHARLMAALFLVFLLLTLALVLLARGPQQGAFRYLVF